VRSNIAIVICAAALVLGLASCSGGNKERPKIGIVLRSFDEERSSALRRELEIEALNKADLSLLDGGGQSAAQGLQVKALLDDKKLAALAIEPADSSALGDVIAAAKAQRVPLVVFGSLPSEDTMRSWDKLFFVGSRDQDSGFAQGEIVAASWKANPAADRNKDKVLQYAIVGIEDERSPRAEGFAKALAAAGITAEPIGAVVDASSLAKLGAKLEAAVCVDLAATLGVIDYFGASKAKAKKQNFLVAGVSTEALPDAIAAAIDDGSLAGVAAGDESGTGKAVCDLAYALARGENPSKYGLKVSDAKYVWVPSVKITKGAGAK
jgi:ABC-type sugar transport system, periplasmic component